MPMCVYLVSDTIFLFSPPSPAIQAQMKAHVESRRSSRVVAFDVSETASMRLSFAGGVAPVLSAGGVAPVLTPNQPSRTRTPRVSCEPVDHVNDDIEITAFPVAPLQDDIKHTMSKDAAQLTQRDDLEASVVV